ncbi:uncharacterized protein LOC125513139 [Triticum urartu]|uniref:Uncharacterized protein n=1 Tax=Triticum turgidum subsp. durum TaxID=4567 RepID=A0A9R1B5B6_TRITD|nr:uncharacterized protein LOC125513139 [Triticum urartu]VAI52018.1 unnamed protein product [Triticum turgidum subsp. durum]
MASAPRFCAVAHFTADEAAPPETLHVMRLQRLRLRRAAAGCLDPIAEEEDSDADDAQVPAGSPSAHSSTGGRRRRAAVDLARCLR